MGKKRESIEELMIESQDLLDSKEAKGILIRMSCIFNFESVMVEV